MVIYKVTNKINGKVYIGQTVESLAKRRSRHLYSARIDDTHSIFLRALNKYGKEVFKWEEICVCNSRQELDSKENYYINFFESTNLDKGYNLIAGRGRSGYKHSESTKYKISKKAKKRLKNPENNPMYGKQHSKNTRQLISEALKDKFSGAKTHFSVRGTLKSQEIRCLRVEVV